MVRFYFKLTMLGVYLWIKIGGSGTYASSPRILGSKLYALIQKSDLRIASYDTSTGIASNELQLDLSASPSATTIISNRLISDGSTTLYILLGVISDVFSVADQETWFMSIDSNLNLKYFLRKKAPATASFLSHYILNLHIGTSTIY
jgi:hypothetical protein